MINPKADDHGRKVIYRKAYRVDGKQVVGCFEEGVITSFNDEYVFVRYGKDTHSMATRREDLKWTSDI